MLNNSRHNGKSAVQTCLVVSSSPVFEKKKKTNSNGNNEILLTQPAAVQLRSHRDVTVPSARVDAHVTGMEGSQEAMGDNEVSLLIAGEYLWMECI